MENRDTSDQNRQQRCFVVMGFGLKTDLSTGRTLNLDKSYQLLIKPVVESKGLICLRADEIRHSGSIEEAMYQELLTADLVIADLSTANANALYELGIRHALRPFTTIVISDNKLPYPFDLNHILITGYTHLGDSIDFDEVMRFRNVLGNLVDAVLAEQNTDSPVYTFLQKLTPPKLEKAIAEVSKALDAESNLIKTPAHTPPAASEENTTLFTYIQRGEQALQKSEFIEAKISFGKALKLCNKTESIDHRSQDTYLIQRLVLATYKAEQPDRVTALNDALKLLEPLNLAESNDPETIGLAGAIEKKLYESDEGNHHLKYSIRYYERGYFLKNDLYNGINLAYLLNMRAASTIYPNMREKIADIILANRIRREIIALCQQTLIQIKDQLANTKNQFDRATKKTDEIDIKMAIKKLEAEQFWCLSTKATAHFGLGELADYKKENGLIKKLKPKPAPWMIDSYETQIKKLNEILNQPENLL